MNCYPNYRRLKLGLEKFVDFFPEISRQQLWNFQFRISEIASMLEVSSRTVSRRLAALNLQVRYRYSRISDRRLVYMIPQLQNEYPNAGYRILQGMLAARGFHVQEQCIWEAMIRVDPLGVTLR